MRLTGDMARYLWSINDRKMSQAEPLEMGLGQRVRIKFVNETMMEHPMHLHGVFMELVNGNGVFGPRKHTIIVAPAETVELDATFEGRRHVGLPLPPLLPRRHRDDAPGQGRLRITPMQKNMGAALRRAGGALLATVALGAQAMEDESIYSYTLIEADAGKVRGQSGSAQSLAIDGWVGGDFNRLWYQLDTERRGGRTEAAELQLLYGRYIGAVLGRADRPAPGRAAQRPRLLGARRARARALCLRCRSEAVRA